MKTNFIALIRTARLAAGRWFTVCVLLSAAGVRAAEPAFTNLTATVAAGLRDIGFGSVAWGDYDNDGRLDFLLTGDFSTGGDGTGVTSELWRNTGSGFTNVTARVAPGLPAVDQSSVAWGDYDNDGRLDLLVTGSFTSQIWRNTGGGFTNVTATVAPGLPGVYGSSVAWGDFDNDGRLDFLLTGFTYGENWSRIYIAQLWRNTGGGFTNVTSTFAPGLPGVFWGSVAWGDYDNDGRLDFLLTGVTHYEPVPESDSESIIDSVSQVWRNTGSGFSNVTASVAPGLPAVSNSIVALSPAGYNSSVAWGDFDNDGRLDFSLTGSGYSQLWRNTGSGFSNVTATVAPGLPGLDYSSVAWGDYDQDGRLDFLLTGFWAYPTNRYVSQLWRNTGSGFIDVTANAVPGLAAVADASVTWVDYDNDGRLDFLLSGAVDLGCDVCEPAVVCQLWRNIIPLTNPPPAVTTQVPTSVSQTSMVLNASINPYGRSAHAWFIWGNSTNYGNVTPVQPNGNSFTNYSFTITGLSTGVTYYYRAVASNDQGQVVLGNEQHLLLVLPRVNTYPVNHLSQTSSRMDGLGYPNGLPTHGWFEWGLTPAFGQITLATFLGDDMSGGAWIGNNYLYGLQSSTAYYFRAVVSNSLAVVYGETQSFVTPDSNICASAIGPMDRNHGYAATSGTVGVGAPTTCPWNVVNTNSWIRILSGASGMGYGEVDYSVEENTNVPSRSGNIKIAGWNFAITQAGQDPLFDAQPTNQSVFAGETVSFHVSVRGTPPITYQWESDSVQAHHVPLVDGDGISGAFTPDLVFSNVRPSQAGTYKVWVTTGVGRNDSVYVSLNVSCGFNLSASNASFNSLSATGSVTLNTVSTNCAWSIANTNPWVLILSSITNSGNGTVLYALTPNNIGVARSGNILIADQILTITQSGGAPTNAPISLEAALDTEGTLTWDTIGIPVWFGQTLVSHDGEDAAQSGPISHDAAVTAWSAITGPGTLSFWWKVSSETNKDFLKFFVHGVQQTRISGETDWQLLSYTFPPGTYTSKWTYSKNEQVSLGNDRGWFDQVSFRAGAGCIGTLSHSNATHSSASETGQVSVTVADGCVLNAITLTPWITNMVDSSSDLVRYVLATNSLPWSRTGLVVIAGQPFTVVQQGAPLSCAISISPTLRTHGYSSATGAIAVTAHENCEWRVLNTNEWVTIGSNGSGNGQLFYSIPANPLARDRSGYIRIDAQVFFICQVGHPPCSYSVQPISRPVTSGSTTGVVDVTTQEWCPWTASTTNAWVTILSVTSNSLGGQVFYSIAANPTSSTREGKIQIGNSFFYITQSPGPAPCSYSILPTSRIHGYGATSNFVTVTTQTGCHWNVINTNGWVAIVSGFINSGSGQLFYSLSVNSTPVARSGNIIIGGRTFLLTQTGAPTNAPLLQLMGLTGNVATLSVQGEQGRMYVLEGSDDLIHWIPISTNSAPSIVTDASAGNAPHRFYRTLEVP